MIEGITDNKIDFGKHCFFLYTNQNRRYIKQRIAFTDKYTTMA